MREGWPAPTRPLLSTTSRLVSPTGGAVSGYPGSVQRRGRGIWRTEDPAPTVTLTRLQMTIFTTIRTSRENNDLFFSQVTEVLVKTCCLDE